MYEQLNDDLHSQEAELISELDILHSEIEALLALVEQKEVELECVRKKILQADKKQSVAA